MFKCLNKFQGKSIRLSYEGKIRLSPILLGTFYYEEFNNSICLYSDGENFARFWKDDVKAINTYDEDTAEVQFTDDSYIILGSEVYCDEDTSL